MGAKGKPKKAESHFWHPILVGVVVAAVHAAFIRFHVYPQSQVLWFGQNPDDFPGLTPVTSQTLILHIALHLLALLLFLVSFVRVIVTDPGSVPTATTPWRDGQFGISARDEQKFKALLLGPDIEKLNKQSSSSYLREYCLKHRSYLTSMSGSEATEAKLSDDEYMNNWLEFLKNFPVVHRRWPKSGDELNGIEPGIKRQCLHRRCGQFKPDRSHHCRVCNRCILRMDHHCPWVNNCLGFYNYKFFILTLLYATLASLSVLVPLLPYILKDAREKEITGSMDVAIGFSMLAVLLLCALIAVGTGAFFGHHMFLVVNAMTHIEWKECATRNNAVRNHRFAVGHAKFEQSAYNNIRHVFGEWWTWWLPTAAHGSGAGFEDGLYLVGRLEEDRPVCG